MGDKCSDCYSNSDIVHCKNTRGAQLHVTVTGGNTLITVGFGSLDAICNTPPPYTSMFLEDVDFLNFKNDYNDNSVCGNNFAFKNHGNAIDATAGHYLTRVTCTNCDADA